MGFGIIHKYKVVPPEYGHEDFNGELTVYDICNDQGGNWQDHVVSKFKVRGKTLKECFEQAYQTDRSNRYCSGYRICFKDPEIQKQYESWKHTGVTMEMYYGSATVD